MLQKLDTVVHNGQNKTIWHSTNIVNSPTLALILETYTEILKKGWVTPGFPFKNTSMVIWAENSDNRIEGGICFDIMPGRKECWINLSFTDPEFRGIGVNELCHEYLEKICKKYNLLSIGSVVAVDNVARMKSALKVGMKPKFYRMLKKI